MTTTQMILGAIVLFLLPGIIFTFIDPKKLGEKIDRATKSMKEKTK